MVCVISVAGLWLESTTVTWSGPHGQLTDPRFEMEQHRDGTLRLHLGSCRVTDAGEYTCTISCAGHSIACSARINLAHDVIEEEDETAVKSEVKEACVAGAAGGGEAGEEEQPQEEEDVEGTEASDRVVWLSGFQRKYSVMHDLGKGRFSVVKRCQRNGDGVEVAVKFVRRARQERPATEREYQLLRRLQHPSLVRSIALYNATPKFDILILELIMGLPLLDWIFTREETTEADCAVLVKQVIKALQYLHSACVSYLDLKPENLLVDILRTRNDGGRCSIPQDDNLPAVRLIDFGSARSLASFEKNTGNGSDQETPMKELRVPPECPPVVLGSPEFMAPEMLARKEVGVQADYWGLGVLIYVLVSGRSPFLGTSPEATCRNILSGDITFPVEYFASVTQEACDLIHDLLAFKPEDRVELQEALGHSWFNMEECESLLPIQSLADYSFRRSKVVSSVQVITPQAPSQ